MTIEMPWVLDTRLAPGEKPKRNPVWGILAASGAAVGVVMFAIALSLVFSGLGQPLIWLLPVWGILTLATIAFSIAALARRGTLNVSLGITALVVVVLANPIIPLLLGILSGVVT